MRWFEVVFGFFSFGYSWVFLFGGAVGWRFGVYSSGNGKRNVASMEFWSWEHSDYINRCRNIEIT